MVTGARLTDGCVVGAESVFLVAGLSCTGGLDWDVPLDCESVAGLTGVAIVGLIWVVAHGGGIAVVPTALGVNAGDDLLFFLSVADVDFEAAAFVTLAISGFFRVHVLAVPFFAGGFSETATVCLLEVFSVSVDLYLNSMGGVMCLLINVLGKLTIRFDGKIGLS